MNQSPAIPPNSTAEGIRWPWFVLGCSCLLVGSVYLSFVELGDTSIAENLNPQSDTLTIAETTQNVPE